MQHFHIRYFARGRSLGGQSVPAASPAAALASPAVQAFQARLAVNYPGLHISHRIVALPAS
ncbi:hypothetical protein [Micromonospora sp. WMMC273]|uniref:hypothetical protein n=1 Tax=Micromonospora sp. WMMC273 TaxID=3015157 RepID=UPI0022B6D568|nr:hypothetical protein [Micromonospora sp. WMMC273]MCZ7478918.1 hypothetical protein [Micromonospora sp. WMMC273]